ncbi:MAG: Abhydrolase protein [Bacteroidota bacterium]|nr:Abhydrolase protein [Bacteroidota bacterium]
MLVNLQRSIIFHPKKLAKDHVFKSDYPLTEYFFEFNIQGNDYFINVVHLRAENSKGLVFFLHGTFKNIQFAITRVEEYLLNHYDVVIMDYQGYGKSTGKLTEELLHDVVEMTFEKIKDELKYKGEIIICGRSLGTALASNLAGKVNPKKLILISPYYSMPDLFHYHSRFNFPNLNFRFENYTYLPMVNCETFILHGDRDKLIPSKLSKKLIPHLKDQENYKEISGAGHFDVHTYPKYKEAIKNILS